MKSKAAFFVLTMILTGCTPKLFRSLDMRPVTSVKMSRGTLMPAFDNLEEAKYFTAQLDYKDNAMGGVFALTKEADGRFRMVMMTTFGVPIFDFSVSRDSFIVNSCMEQMNKKTVLGILEKDFRTILMLNVPEKFSARLYRNNARKDWMGYGVNADDGECDFIVYPQGKDFVRRVQNGGVIKRMDAVFDDRVVTLQHPKLGLKIVLTAIE